MKKRWGWGTVFMGFLLVGSVVTSGVHGKHLEPSVAKEGAPPDCHGEFQGEKVSTEALQQILNAHARWLDNHNDPQGKQANLCGADLGGVDFREENLNGGNFQGANLARADFTAAKLVHVNFHKANVTEASLYSVDMRGADATGATFRMADFRKADLSQANFAGADLREANLAESGFAGEFCVG